MSSAMFQDAIRRMQMDPKYRNLSYLEQQKAVKVVLDSFIVKDPSFLALDATQRANAYQTALQGAVVQLKPTMNKDNGQLTDQERLLLDSGQNVGPQTAYKKSLRLGERLDAGDPKAMQEASDWITWNRVGTNSLLVQIAAGAKDAVEVVFGQDDQMFNDLRFQNKDYNKLTDYLLSKMPAVKRREATTEAGAAGFATGMLEVSLMNIFGVGTLRHPGLFTKGLWAQVGKRKAAALVGGEVTKWASTVPYAIEGIGGGTVDLVRSLPKLIETRQLDGNGAFWKQAAQVFGEGVAYDVLFNGLQDIWRLAIKPSVQMLKGFDLKDQKSVKQLEEALAFVDPDNMGLAFSKILDGNLPEELLQRVPGKDRQRLVNVFKRFDALTSTKIFSEDTPEGFKFIAKAMGMDVELKDGKVHLVTASGKTYRKFNTYAEAVSFAQARKWKPLDPELDEALLGAQRDIRIRKYTRTDKELTKLSRRQKIHMIGQMGTGGQVDYETTTALIDDLWKTRKQGRELPNDLRYESVTEQDWLKDHLTRGPDGYVHYRQQVWPNPEFNTVKIPQTMSFDTRDTFLRYMDDIIRRGDPEVSSLMAGVTSLSDEGLDYAAKRMNPQAQVVRQGNKWLYKMPGIPDRTFYTQGSVNRELFRDLYQSGTMTEDEYITLFKRSTGYSIKVKDIAPETGLPSYEVWDRRGRMIDRADNLDVLLNKSYEYNVKLPDFLIPGTLVRDGKLFVGETIAMGNTTDMYKFLDNFESLALSSEKTINWPLATGRNAQVTLDPTKYEIAIEIPSLRYVTKFGDERQAKEFLDKVGKSVGVLEQIAYDKGFRMDTMSSGSLVFRDASGNGTVVHSAREAEEFLAKWPSKNTLGAELASGLPEEAMDAIGLSVKRALSKMPEFKAKVQYPEGTLFKTSIGKWIDATFAPFSSWAERTAQRLNMPELTEVVRNGVLSRQMVSIKNFQRASQIKQILTDPETGKLISKGKRQLFARLLEVNPENWQKAASIMESGNVLSAGDIRVLTATREYFKTLGTQFNIDFLGFFTNYTPHMFEKKGLPELIESLKKGLTRDQMLAEMFGPNYKNIPAVEFLARNSRVDEFINMHNRKDIVELMTYYTEKGYREMYLKKPIEDIKNLAESLKEKVDEQELARLVQFGAALAGETPDDAVGRSIRSLSIAASERLYKGFEYLAELSGGDAKPLGRTFKVMMDHSVSENWLQKMSQNVSVATLGFRPMRILSNLGQSMNTYAVFGHWFFDASRDIDSNYIKKLFQKGIINEKIFAAAADGMEHIKGTISDMGMFWQQNSEYYTRALTAKSTELAFDNALPKLISGQINFQQFLDLSNLTFLGAQTHDEMYQLLAKGQVEAAKDAAIRDAVTILMFDYSKENLPGMFQGTLGRLYGKFGVFKVGQVDMYRRFLKSSNTSQGKQRLIRLAAGSFVVYNAFQAAGIDYNGFTLQDPLDLTGGPVWETLVDISRSTGSGPEAQLAKSNMWRNLTPALKMQNGRIVMGGRLWIPGALQINSLLKSWDTLSNGDYYGAFLDGLSAPRNTEPFDLMKWLD